MGNLSTMLGLLQSENLENYDISSFNKSVGKHKKSRLPKNPFTFMADYFKDYEYPVITNSIVLKLLEEKYKEKFSLTALEDQQYHEYIFKSKNNRFVVKMIGEDITECNSYLRLLEDNVSQEEREGKVLNYFTLLQFPTYAEHVRYGSEIIKKGKERGKVYFKSPYSCDDKVILFKIQKPIRDLILSYLSKFKLIPTRFHTDYLEF